MFAVEDNPRSHNNYEGWHYFLKYTPDNKNIEMAKLPFYTDNDSYL